MFAWLILGSSGPYLKLSSWMFLEPGLDFDRVQLSFLLDFYLRDTKLNFLMLSPFILLQTEENAPSGRSPWEPASFPKPIDPFRFGQ